MNFELILVGPVGCQECEICKFFAVCITVIVSHCHKSLCSAKSAGPHTSQKR